MTNPYTLDPRTVCFRCETNPLRVPLVFNGTDPDTGNYWCQSCDRAETLDRIAAIRNQPQR